MDNPSQSIIEPSSAAMATQSGSCITVVIPCFNAEKWVGRTIRSALEQVGVEVEVIVIDDGSTDGSLDVIKTFGSCIRFETGPNRGACAARNLGLALSSAPYVMFLDADDYVEGPLLASGVAEMEARQADLGFGVSVAEDARGRRISEPPSIASNMDAIFLLLGEHFVATCSTVWRRSFIARIDGWRVGLRRNQDFEIVFRALSHRPRVASWRSGAGVANQHTGIGRISHRTDALTFADQVDVLFATRSALIEIGLSEDQADNLLKRKAYGLLRQTARSGTAEMRATARRNWQQFGGRGHLGSVKHVMLAHLLGLRNKERLARFLQSMRR